MFYNVINKNATLLPEEKNVQLLLSEKFLNNLRPFTWFIVAKFKGYDGYEQLLKDIRTSLAEYMEKSKIAEYVSLMVMELAMNAENSNLKREAKAIFKGAVDMNAVLFDPNIRKQVLESLERRGELVYLSWKIGSRNASIGTQGKLQITLFNKESEYRNVKEVIEDRNERRSQEKKPQWTSTANSPRVRPTRNWASTTSLTSRRPCEKVNIKFESLVNQLPGSDLTVITLSLGI